MKKYLHFIIFVLLLPFYFTACRNDVSPPNQKKLETKTDEQASVTVEVTPLELSKEAKTWNFTVAFTTHSGNLDQDLTKVAVLTDDKGNVYQPTAWEGSPPGGHHRSGTLIFNSLNPTPKFIELKIKDVGGVPERSFKWNLETF